MAGHSKWQNIKRTKEANDAKRNKIFTKLARDIANAAKLGNSGDVSMNPMLNVAVEKAKSANMTNDRIQAAIDRGLGITDNADIVFLNTYEYYSPKGIAVLVDTETNNPNRTNSDLKTLVSKLGGKVASEGSLSWQFEEVGEIVASVEEGEESEKIILEIMEFSGVLDVTQKSQDQIKITTDRTSLSDVTKNLQQIPVQLNSADLIKKPSTPMPTNKLDFESLKKFLEHIEDYQDVVSIWHNATVS